MTLTRSEPLKRIGRKIIKSVKVIHQRAVRQFRLARAEAHGQFPRRRDHPPPSTRKLAALEALKKSLLHQAFTGEL